MHRRSPARPRQARRTTRPLAVLVHPRGHARDRAPPSHRAADFADDRPPLAPRSACGSADDPLWIERVTLRHRDTESWQAPGVASVRRRRPAAVRYARPPHSPDVSTTGPTVTTGHRRHSARQRRARTVTTCARSGSRALDISTGALQSPESSANSRPVPSSKPYQSLIKETPCRFPCEPHIDPNSLAPIGGRSSRTRAKGAECSSIGLLIRYPKLCGLRLVTAAPSARIRACFNLLVRPY